MAHLQYEMLNNNPYQYTSDDVLFSVFATRKECPENEMDERRDIYFSKEQACFRASPLTKRYGFGIDSDAQGKIAMNGAETQKYATLLADYTVINIKAMRSTRA